MSFDELPGWQAYYDAQLAILRDVFARSERQEKLEFDEFMRRQAEDSARSDRVQQLRAQVFARLRPTDVAALLDAIDGDEITVEQRPLVFFVVDLARTNDPRMTPPERERLAQMLEHKMRHAYPQDGGLYWFLRGVDADRAAGAVLAAFDRVEPSALARKEAETLTSDLKNLSQRGLPALQRLAALGGDIGEMAVKNLEGLGQFAPGRVEEVAARWRRTGTREDLDWLYWHVITRYGEGTVPIDQLRELLGEPTASDAHMFTWDTHEAHPIQLAIGVDDRKMIVSYKLK